MNKIVELVIDFEDLEFEDLGVEIMSLVDAPAIAVNWMAFSEEFVVNPLPGEGESDFISRCIATEVDAGYDQDQAAAICYSKWEDTKFKFDEDEWFDAVLKLAESDEYGTKIDENVVFIDGTKEQFESVSDIAQGIRALDILDGEDVGRQIETRYRYRGSIKPNSRNFCRAMVALNKMYSFEEIEVMSSLPLQPGMGPGGNNTYNIFFYKGGVNCGHYWEQLSVFERNGQTVIISEGPVRGDAGEVAGPRNNYWRMGAQWQFSNDDKMIVTGPAMIPNQLIPRKDAMGNLFHVYFSKETIANIAKKFLADQNAHNTDINHNDEVVQENTLLESWIVDDPKMDKSTALGFNVPSGTWMTSYKINNKDTWSKIKNGELNGFSVTGQFIEKLQS